MVVVRYKRVVVKHKNWSQHWATREQLGGTCSSMMERELELAQTDRFVMFKREQLQF